MSRDTIGISHHPEVSVIIPAYNAEQLLSFAVQSVLQQTLTDFEIIIVDDGSTDKTLSLARSFDDSRVRVYAQFNRGQSAAVNYGVSVSNGRFIKLLDADDWLNPSHLEIQLQSLTGFPQHISSAQWCYFRHAPESAAARQEATDHHYDDPLHWFADSFRLDEGMVGGWRWLIPRAVWDKTSGYDETLTLYNDVEFATRLLLAASGVCFAPGAVYGYRCGVDSSMSNDASFRTLDSVYRACSIAASHFEKAGRRDLHSILADRLQVFMYQSYPRFPDLAEKIADQICFIGGSAVPLPGGKTAKFLEKFIGWKLVRRLQTTARKTAWSRVQSKKQRTRLSDFP